MKNIDLEKMLSFCKKNFRYIAAGVLIIILIIVLVNCTNVAGDKNAITSTQVSGGDGEFKVDKNKDINNLVTNYFTAYANGDLDSLSKLATPISDNEKSYITMFSQYVESYQGIKCYVKQGLDKNSYLVSVYLEMKFKDVDTVAPGLDFFYIQKDDQGNYTINNLYSQYNLLNKEQELDANVEKLINKYEKEDDVVELQNEVQTKYNAAIAADTNLATMVNTTIANAYTAWSAQIATQSAAASTQATSEASTQATSETTTQPASEASTQATSEAAQPATEAAQPTTPDVPAATDTGITATNDTVYALDTINIRDAASDTANKLGSATIGAKFTRNGTTADGWSQIQYNGGVAYVKSDYLTTDASQTGAGAQSSNSTTSVTEGTKVQLSSTTNIRSSMSDSSDRVGVAYQGDTVTVVASYAEGWTKVSWNGKTGYIKTDLLK